MTLCDFCSKMPRTQVFHSKCSCGTDLYWGLFNVLGREGTGHSPVGSSVRGDSAWVLEIRVGFPEEEATIAKMILLEVRQSQENKGKHVCKGPDIGGACLYGKEKGEKRREGL